MTVTSRLALPTLALAALSLSACGSSSNNSASTSTASPAPAATSTSSQGTPSAAAGTLALSARESGGLSFDKKQLQAKAGKVTLAMSNPGSDSLPHGIAVEGNGVDKDGKTVQPGGTSTVTVTLKPGRYTFYCPVPGHRAGGMQGTLVVS
jgi:uncharacterized cupredoxin-like copper-binding protein